MDKSGIATSILSIVQPGVWYGDNVEESRRLARQLNEYGAKVVKDHPGRFGLFAVIAPPDVQGSLKEIEYALDTLKADGIGLLTSYQDKYLGDPSFAPVYEELNRRKAVVYVHPTTPACCRGLVPGIPPGSIEYATNSTRTIAHLVFSGTAMKFPDIRWIFSHSGGTLPFLTGRFIRLAEERKPAHLPDGPLPEFRKFYYELAQGNTPGQIAALLKMVSISQVLYGTDYPFRDGAEVNPASRTGASRRPICAPSSARTRSSCCRASRRPERATKPAPPSSSVAGSRSFPCGALRRRLGTPVAQPATVLQFAASCSAPRSDSARIV